MIPTGNSIGERITLAMVSETKSKTPPKIIDNGIKNLCFEENKILIMCGEIKPTNPIVPPAQTEQDTQILPVIKIKNLVFFTFKPKACAEISPTEIKSRYFPETKIKIKETQKGIIKK